MATRPRLPTVLGLALLLSLPPLGAAPEGSWKDLRGRPTGFFHVEKLGSAWWIVDPDGRPFISKGVNHVSYAGDNSPKLGFSPYRKAVEAKHGSAEAWARASVERLRGWGFNTIGAWSSRETWRQGMPYTVILDLGSSAGGDWLKGSFPDVFSERFREAVRKAAQERCAPRRGDWLLLGYFTDNELRWGRDWRSKRGLLADFLELPEGSAGRREAERYVKGRRGEAGTSPLGEKDLEALEAGFVKLVASEYFKACAEAVRAADPDHMVLGCRFAGYAPQAVLEALGEHADLVSYNNYGSLPPAGELERVHRATGRPVMLTELSFKAMDSGLPNTRGAGKPVATQLDRAQRFEEYVTALMKLPFAVGYHWFEHADEPAEGRFDGENSNYGVVDIRDEPWDVLTSRMREVNARIEEIHAGAAGGAGAAAPAAAAERKGPVNLHVSPSGSDVGSGTREAPFATFERARDALRELKARGPLPEGGATVWLEPGLHVLRRTFELTEADSGRADAPVEYRASQRGAARVLGGRPVAGFRPVTDPAVLERLDPRVRGAVLEADLRAQGVEDLGKLRSRGFGRATAPAHLELFHRGRPMTLARWPDEGFVKISGHGDPEPASDGHGGKLGRLEHGFTYEGDRPRRWKSHEGLWVHGYWAWDWANTYEEVASIDLERRLVRTAPPHGIYGFRPGQRFYFTNVLEELDQPGEYFADPRRGVLYFLPPSPPAEGDAFVSVLEGPLVSIEGVSHVALRDLVLELGRGSGVRISGGERCLVAGCTLRSLGNHAVLVDGGRGHAVEGCEVHDAGDGGVTLRGGDRAALEPAGHRASGNHVHHVARWSRCYVPAFLVEGVGSTVSGNLVHDHPHCAILYGGNDHTIELNEIHRVCLETGDVGAIYTGRDWTARGTAIRHNFIHHTGGVGMGSMGVYLDDCASGQTVTGNVFWRVQRAAFIGGGRDNAVENNVFVDCDPAVWVDGRGLDPSPVWRDMVAVTMKERLERVKAFEPPYAERYPELKSLIPHYEKGAGVPPEGNRIARNVCSSGPWLKVFWHAKEDMLELRDNLVEQDPGFADAAAGDFRLRDGSPAFAIGFKPIPADRIGRLDPDHGAGPCAAAGPVVEVEEEVARCAPPGNGAGPLWCYGAPLIARRGDEVFASAMETGEGVPLLCNTRPRIFRKRGDGAWELLWRPEGFREREPCPLAALEEALILSVSSSKEPPGTKYGAADPHLLAFHAPGSPGGSGGPAGSGLAAPEPLRPPWPAEATFTDHSYRGLAVDAARGEVLALNIDARSSEQRWSFRDAPGAWSSSGAIRFPIRSCYPQVALRDRAAHVLAIGDIVEPVEEWKRYKSETTGSAWDYVFRRLFYSWARDIGREGFSEPLEVETADATAGHISNLDLWIDAAGAAHLLYTRRNVSSPLLRDRFFPGTPIATALVHVVVVDGRIARRETLLEGGEGRGGAVPGHARLHAAGDGRLFAVFFVSGSDGGRPVSEDRLIEVLPERGRAVRIPLRQPFTSFFTACERGGSAPSRVLDLFGIAGDGQVLRYARVRLPER